MEDRMRSPAEEAGPPPEASAQGACGLNLTPEERKLVIDALLQEIDRTQRWTRLVAELNAEIARQPLTNAERDALEAAVGRSDRLGTEYAIIDAATLRGLLERVDTPAMQTTPGECSSSNEGT